MDSPQASVLVVEKHPLMREAICAAIQDDPFLYVAAQSPTGEDAYMGLNSPPDVILYSEELLDWNAISQLQQLLPNVPIVVMTQSELLDVEQPGVDRGLIMIPRSATCLELIHALYNVP